MHAALPELLDYPDDELLDRRGRVAARAPGRLGPFVTWWAAADGRLLRERYVADFDLASRTSLYLTYHRFGDRRERGRALIALKRLYREAGWELEHWELPDYLPLVLEFAAVEPDAGRELLAGFRTELETIRRGLADRGSPWEAVLAYVLSGLPAVDDAAVERLQAEGPPTELVGVER